MHISFVALISGGHLVCWLKGGCIRVYAVECSFMMHKSNFRRALPRAIVTQTIFSGEGAPREICGRPFDISSTSQPICEHLVFLWRIKSRGSGSAPEA